jgi:hypothetical protein
MIVRQGRSLILMLTLVTAACQHPFNQQDALTAIEHHETLHRLLAPDTERVARETVADCRAIYSDDPAVAESAGDSAWILLSTAGWLDLADVDAPSDTRQKKHCRAVLTSKATKAAFHEPQTPTESPWTTYWVVETAHATAEIVGLPESQRSDEAVADFLITQERTPVGELLHRPKWSDEAHLYSTTLTGHFRRADGAWRLERFDEAK